MKQIDDVKNYLISFSDQQVIFLTLLFYIKTETLNLFLQRDILDKVRLYLKDLDEKNKNTDLDDSSDLITSPVSTKQVILGKSNKILCTNLTSGAKIVPLFNTYQKLEK